MKIRALINFVVTETYTECLFSHDSVHLSLRFAGYVASLLPHRFPMCPFPSRYPGVKIVNFTNSWRNGLGFNALIHAHRPDLIAYEELIPSEHIDNLNNAFNVADESLGIHKILDAEG